MRKGRTQAPVKVAGVLAHQINNPSRTPKTVAAMKERVKAAIQRRIRKEKIQAFVLIQASKKNLEGMSRRTLTYKLKSYCS